MTNDYYEKLLNAMCEYNTAKEKSRMWQQRELELKKQLEKLKGEQQNG